MPMLALAFLQACHDRPVGLSCCHVRPRRPRMCGVVAACSDREAPTPGGTARPGPLRAVPVRAQPRARHVRTAFFAVESAGTKNAARRWIATVPSQCALSRPGSTGPGLSRRASLAISPRRRPSHLVCMRCRRRHGWQPVAALHPAPPGHRPALLWLGLSNPAPPQPACTRLDPGAVWALHRRLGSWLACSPTRRICPCVPARRPLGARVRAGPGHLVAACLGGGAVGQSVGDAPGWRGLCP